MYSKLKQTHLGLLK